LNIARKTLVLKEASNALVNAESVAASLLPKSDENAEVKDSTNAKI
jgi:hypothetical protein